MNDVTAILRADFLEGMSRVASTVSVVTTDGPAGRAGVTVSTMASVSADGPSPILLICVHHQARAVDTILANGCFCTNTLNAEQAYISDCFAGRSIPEGDDKFACADWTAMKTGSLRVVNPLSAFDCKIIETKRVGTHHVIFGAVQDVFVGNQDKALLFSNRNYATVGPIEEISDDDASAQVLKVMR